MESNELAVVGSQTPLERPRVNPLRSRIFELVIPFKRTAIESGVPRFRISRLGRSRLLTRSLLILSVHAAKICNNRNDDKGSSYSQRELIPILPFYPQTCKIKSPRRWSWDKGLIT